MEAIAKRKQLEQKDTITVAPTPMTAKAPPTTLSANAEVKPDSTQSSSPYKHLEENQHWTIFAMENTEPVLAAEAMRAIERYNRETFFNRSFTTQLVNLDSRYRLITIGPFGNFRESTFEWTISCPLQLPPASRIEHYPLPTHKVGPGDVGRSALAESIALFRMW